jgi:hypothetical protein
MKAVKTEGLPFFFRGWTAAWYAFLFRLRECELMIRRRVRLCPQTILTLVFLEQLRLGVDVLRGDTTVL